MKYALENGMINLSYVQEQIEMNKREEILNQHPYGIWQGKDENWYTYFPDDKKGRRLKKRSSEKAIKDDIVVFWKEKCNDPTIYEVFNEWNDRRLGLQKISKSSHLRYQQIFTRHFSDMKNCKIKSISPEEIEEFLEEQVPKFNMTAKAFSNLKTVTKGFLKRAKKRKLINFNVEELFGELDTSESNFRHMVKDDSKEVFDDIEMQSMTEYLKNHPDIINLSILLMFYTGLRIGELATLKWSDFKENSITIQRTETRFLNEDGHEVFEVKDFPKTEAGIRVVVIPKDAVWIVKKLKTFNPFSEFVFVRNGERIKTYIIRKRVYQVCKITGCVIKSPHKIRKTYGTILLDNHIDNKLIVGQMGHTNIICTENHYHRNRKSIEQKSEILSKIPDFKAN